MAPHAVLRPAGLPSSEHENNGLVVGHEPTIGHALKFIFQDYMMTMMVFAPLGILAGLLEWSASTQFILNFLAIIPLAKLLGVVTEDLSLRVGESAGGLLNATFGNAIELIITFFALRNNLTEVVKASLLGSILSNVLLVLGGAFLVSGCYRKISRFNVLAAQTSSSLLFMAVLAFVLPTAYSSHNIREALDSLSDKTLKFSRLTSIIVLFVYIMFLVFQLHTHRRHITGTYEESPAMLDPPSVVRRLSNASEHGIGEIEQSQMPSWFAVVMLFAVTLLVSFCSEYLVSTLEEVSKQWHISEAFIGLILLPIVGNAAEHVTAITVAAKDKMDLSLSVAVGSSMQIALFVTPLAVLMGWIMNIPMSLQFTNFEASTIFVSVLMVNYIIGDGKSNWLEGVMLLATYLIIALAYWL